MANPSLQLAQSSVWNSCARIKPLASISRISTAWAGSKRISPATAACPGAPGEQPSG